VRQLFWGVTRPSIKAARRGSVWQAVAEIARTYSEADAALPAAWSVSVCCGATAWRVANAKAKGLPKFTR